MAGTLRPRCPRAGDPEACLMSHHGRSEPPAKSVPQCSPRTGPPPPGPPASGQPLYPRMLSRGRLFPGLSPQPVVWHPQAPCVRPGASRVLADEWVREDVKSSADPLTRRAHMGTRPNEATAAQQAQQDSCIHVQVELDSEALRPAPVWGTLGGVSPRDLASPVPPA